MLKLCLSCFLIAWSVFCHAEVVRIATGEYPPFTSKKQPEYNTVNRIITEAFEREGITVEFHYYPWARAYQEALAGHYDATSYWFESKDRRKDFLYSEPVVVTPTYFFHAKDAIFSWENIADLKGKKISVTRGYTYSDEFIHAGKQGDYQLHWSNTDVQGFKMLLAHRTDLFPIEIYPAQFLLKKHFTPAQRNQITFFKKPLANSKGHLLFPKSSERSQALLKRFNKALADLKKQGRFDSIYQSVVKNHTADSISTKTN